MTPQEIVASLCGDWHGSYGVAPCPICQPEGGLSNRALSVMDRNGYPYITCFKGCNSAEIKAVLGVKDRKFAPDDEARKNREIERIRMQEKAAKKAAIIMARTKIGAHPYLERKGFPQQRAPIAFGDTIALPLRDFTGKLWSVQFIDERGGKRYLKGGRLSGCGLKIGHQGANLALCEGFATGLSILRSASKANVKIDVLCCMSSAGIKNMAKAGISGVVCADRDKDGVGEKAAKSTALPYVMPPELGDFNDFELSYGSGAVWGVLEPHLKL